jgi:hypothetical protein
MMNISLRHHTFSVFPFFKTLYFLLFSLLEIIRSTNLQKLIMFMMKETFLRK